MYDLNTGGTWETNEAAIIEYVITQLGLRATQAAMETFGDALVRWLTTKIAELLPKRITVIFPDGTSIVAVINSTFSFVPGHLDPSSALTANGQKIDLGSLPGGISALEGPDGFERPRASLAGIVGFKKCFRVTYVFPDPPYEERKGTQCEIIW